MKMDRVLVFSLLYQEQGITISGLPQLKAKKKKKEEEEKKKKNNDEKLKLIRQTRRYMAGQTVFWCADGEMNHPKSPSFLSNALK